MLYQIEKREVKQVARKTAEEKAKSRAISNANLKPAPPINTRPEAEQKAIRRKAQQAQQATRRKKKALREICEELLCMECPKDAANLGALTEAATDAATERGEPLDVYEAGLLAQVAQMLQGNTRAAEFVRDSAGDKPGDNLQVQADSVSPADAALLRKVAERQGIQTEDKDDAKD